ncbi:MAG: monofunctional biosynthetic peptidoglycan transglycosylase [Chitinophagales bacterium]
MRNLFKRIWFLTIRIILFLFIIHLVYLFYCKWFFPPLTITQLTSVISGNGLKRDYVCMSEISSNAKLAVIASEDQLFADHSGFDWKSIQKAQKYNEKHPQRVHGASTISQQVAKNVFLWQGRSWLRKGMEVYFTFMIELLYSKERILELYLNVIETGKGVFGIEAASEKYFSKHAKNLSQAEAAMIAASLPNPALYKVKPLSRWVARRYPWIMNQMRKLRGDPAIEALLN